MTRDLFAPALAGLAMQGLVSAGDEAKLIALLGELELAPFRFQGWTGNRLTRSFGWHYDFDDHSFSETDPLPAWLNPLRELAGRLAGEPAARFSHALITRYGPGAGIGWHRDRPIRQGRRLLAGFAGDLAFPAADRDRLRPALDPARTALGLSAVGRGQGRVGTQHRARRRASLFDHAAQRPRGEVAKTRFSQRDQPCDERRNSRAAQGFKSRQLNRE